MNLREVSVAELPGVGPKRLDAIKSLGINSIYDLLFYFPFRYEDMEVKSLDDAVDQEKILLKGVVASEPVVVRFGYKKNRLNVRILVENESIMVTFFNQLATGWVTTGHLRGARFNYFFFYFFYI